MMISIDPCAEEEPLIRGPWSYAKYAIDWIIRALPHLTSLIPIESLHTNTTGGRSPGHIWVASIDAWRRVLKSATRILRGITAPPLRDHGAAGPDEDRPARCAGGRPGAGPAIQRSPGRALLLHH